VSDEPRKLSRGAMTNLMCRGRKRGLAGVIATQRLAKLAKNVAAEASNFLMGRTFLDIDMARAGDLLGMDRRATEMFRDLERGAFVALGPALARRPLPVTIGPVETSARSTSPRLTPLPQAASGEDAADLIFTPGADEDLRVPPRRVTQPAPRPTNDIIAQLSAAPTEPQPETLFPEIDEAERDAAIEAVLGEILEDPDASYRSIAVLYQDFLVRCRIRRVPGSPPDLNDFKRRFSVARAGIDARTAESEIWQKALGLAQSLAEDVQGVFLLLARAALENLPCPSDAALARAYGSHSAGRARRLLTYFEERDLIVLREDFSNRRIAAFPDLGCETAPGDPNAPAEAPGRTAAE
jgi:uncharacterized protein